MVELSPSSKEANAKGVRRVPFLALLAADKFALASAVFLVVLLAAAAFGPPFMEKAATMINLRARNIAPFTLDAGWINILGTDALGRSILARIVVGSRNTLAIAGLAVACAMTAGGVLGLIAGYRGGWVGNVILRVTDVIMSFPSLLLALIVLYALGSDVRNVVLVLAITRIPLYLRTCRAEVLEIRERMFVTASRMLGAKTPRLVFRHIAPMTIPTLTTIATIDYAGVMLSESALSFLGLGVQAPSVSWGLMVAEGQQYLRTAWWISFWPGLAIALTALALNLIAGFFRILSDPQQRWRIENRAARKRNAVPGHPAGR